MTRSAWAGQANAACGLDPDAAPTAESVRWLRRRGHDADRISDFYDVAPNKIAALLAETLA